MRISDWSSDVCSSVFAAAIPESDKTLGIEAFIPCAEVDDVYFDKPYYLTPADSVAEKPYAVIREAIRKANVAALARTVLFRRVRTLLIRTHECGLVATTLNFDRSEEHTSELQALMRSSYTVLCLKKKHK